MQSARVNAGPASAGPHRRPAAEVVHVRDIENTGKRGRNACHQHPQASAVDTVSRQAEDPEHGMQDAGGAPRGRGAAAPRARCGQEQPRNPTGRLTHGSRYAAPFRRAKPRCDTGADREQRARTRRADSGGKPRSGRSRNCRLGRPSSSVNGEGGTAPPSGEADKTRKASKRLATEDIGPGINDGGS